MSPQVELQAHTHTHTYTKDVSASSQGTGPNMKSIVLSMHSGARVTHTYSKTHTETCTTQGLRWSAAVSMHSLTHTHTH